MRLTIKIKLMLTFAVVLLLSALMAVLAIASLASVDATLEEIVAGPAQRLQLVQSIYADLLLENRAQKNVLLAGNAQEAARYESEAQIASQQLQQIREQYLAIATPAGKQKFMAFDSSYQQFHATGPRISQLVSQGHTAEARDLSVGEGRAHMQDAAKQLDNLVRLNKELMAAARADAAQHYAAARFWLIGVVILSLLAGIGGALWMSITIGRGLRLARDAADAVAAGDLGQNVVAHGNDEVRDLVDAMNRMTVNLRATAQLADAVAAGDLSHDARRRSDKDELGIALERMVEKLRATASIADRLVAGDLTIESKRLSDKDVLGTAQGDGETRATADQRRQAERSERTGHGARPGQRQRGSRWRFRSILVLRIC